MIIICNILVNFTDVAPKAAAEVTEEQKFLEYSDFL